MGETMYNMFWAAAISFGAFFMAVLIAAVLPEWLERSEKRSPEKKI